MYTYADGLETERLRTRFVVPEDAIAWTEFMQDKDTSRFMSFVSGNTPEKQAEAMIQFTLKRYAEQRYGLQALMDKTTHEFVGQCGLLLQQLDGLNELEVGYHLFRRHWGKGYAIEAARAFRDYAFESTAVQSVISIIDPLNEPSKKVATRNGMALWAEGKHCLDGIYDVFRITREEWKGLT